MTTTTAIISQEMIDRCFRNVDPSTGLGYYEVQSERDENVIYEVRYSKEHGFTCSCPAGADGFAHCTQRGTCKHVRWSLEAAHQNRINQARIETLMLAGLTRDEAREAISHTLLVDGKPADVATLVRVFSAQGHYPTDAELNKQAALFEGSGAFKFLR